MDALSSAPVQYTSLEPDEFDAEASPEEVEASGPETPEETPEKLGLKEARTRARELGEVL